MCRRCSMARLPSLSCRRLSCNMPGLSHLNVLWAGSNGLHHPHVHPARSAAPLPIFCSRRAAGLHHAVQPVAAPEVVAAVQANAEHADVAARDDVDLVCKGTAGGCSTSPPHTIRLWSLPHAHGCRRANASGEQEQSWNLIMKTLAPWEGPGHWRVHQSQQLVDCWASSSPLPAAGERSQLTQRTTLGGFNLAKAGNAGAPPHLPLSVCRQRMTLADLAGLNTLTCGAEAKLQRDASGVMDGQEAWLPAGYGGPGAPCLICAPQQHIRACRKEERLLLCEVVPRAPVACRRSAQQVIRAADGSLCPSSRINRVQELAEESQLRSACMDMHVAEVGKPWTQL